MIAGIIFFLLFILPFIIAPFGITQFENPKVIIAEAGIILLFLVSFFTTVAIRYKTPQFILYCAIVFLTLVDILFFRTYLSIFGNEFRMQGVFLLWNLLLFSLLSSNISFKNVPWFIFGLLLLIELIAIFFLPLNASQRFVGTLGEPNALAGFAIFLWPFSFFAIKKFYTKEKIGMVFILLIVITILVLSNSRSAMIALGLQVIFISLQKFNLSTAKIVLVCLCLYIASFAFPFFENVPYENRVQVWQAALFAGTVNPVFGQGFGNVEIALHNTTTRLNLPIQYYYVDSAHNLFLDWWVQGGIIGVGILVILIYLTFLQFTKDDNRREFVLLFGMLTVLSFNPASVVGLLGFWWVIGQGWINLSNHPLITPSVN